MNRMLEQGGSSLAPEATKRKVSREGGGGVAEETQAWSGR